MNDYLFLDIDGVLNNTNYHESESSLSYPLSAFCPENVKSFNSLMEEIPNVKVVISSSWRTDSNLQAIFNKVGLNVKIYGITSFMLGCDRSKEVEAYLFGKTYSSYCILDDVNFFNEEQQPHLCLIDENKGFLESDIEKVKAILKSN